MKHFVFISIIAFLMALAAGCSRPAPDPVAEEIGRVVRQETQYPFHVEKATKVDSTTYATELHRRRGIYELRIRQNTARKAKYLDQKMPTNARRMDGFIAKDHLIIAGLDSIRTRMGADTALVAYYDYVFEYCNATPNGKKTEPKKAWATVTPSRKVLTWSANRRDIHKRTGLVIPGYGKLLDDLRVEEDEQ